jgi:AAA domain
MSEYTVEEIKAGLSVDADEPKSTTNGYTNPYELGGKTEFEQLNTDALTNLDAWVPRLFPAATRRSEDKGWRVSSASLGRDLEEDISFAPNGIKDFGVADQGDENEGRRTPIDMVMEANGCDFKAAVLWLCQALGREPIIKADPTKIKSTWSPAIHWHGDADATVERKWLLHGVLPEVGTGLMSGQWGTYKTFTALDLAIAVAIGGQFLDYTVCRKGGTLFIATESSGEIPIRLQAVIDKKHPKTKKLPFAWVEDCPVLLDPKNVEHIVAVAREVDAKMQAEFGLPLALIIIDTIGNAAGYQKSGDENDSTIGLKLMNNLDAVSKQVGAFALAVDHFGKAVETGTRGTSAKETKADAILALLGTKAVSGAVTNTRLAVRKTRGGEQGREFPFTVEKVEMGNDGWNLAMTTLVIRWGEENKAASGADSPFWSSRSLKTLRAALMAVLADKGEELKPKESGPSVRAVELEVLRAEFYRTYFADGDKAANTRRRAFERAVNEAQIRDLIDRQEDGQKTMVWFKLK